MFSVGIDFGTTGCKAIVSDSLGRIAGQAYLEYPLLVLSKFEVEQDAHFWWELPCQAVREAVADSGVPAGQIGAVSVTSQGISFVLVDENLEPVANAISWLDCRAQEEVEDIRRDYSEQEIYSMTGVVLDGVYVLPKLLWMKRHRPEALRRAKKLLMPHDYIIAKLCGAIVTDHTMAGGTMLYDVKNRCWSRELLAHYGIEESLLPELVTAGSRAGTLSRRAAEETGLCEGITVGVGGQDQKVAAFLCKPDLDAVTLSLGTAGAMEFLTDRPAFGDSSRIPLFSYITARCWTFEPVISTTGACLKWLRNTLFPTLSFRSMDQLAETAAPGELFFYPSLNNAEGAFYGISLNTGKEDIISSVLEGIAFQIKKRLLLCEAVCGEKKRMIVFGSGGSSDVWCQIIADVTGKELIALSSPDAAGLGAAKLALMAAGEDISRFGEDVFRSSRRYLPRRQEVYETAYRRYIEQENKL